MRIDIQALILSQDKNFRCTAILRSKKIVASLGNSP